jgi:hypothetical protein
MKTENTKPQHETLAGPFANGYRVQKHGDRYYSVRPDGSLASHTTDFELACRLAETSTPLTKRQKKILARCEWLGLSDIETSRSGN